MFCPKCGKENSDTNNFCKVCGARFPAGGIAAVARRQVPVTPPPTPPFSAGSIISEPPPVADVSPEVEEQRDDAQDELREPLVEVPHEAISDPLEAEQPPDDTQEEEVSASPVPEDTADDARDDSVTALIEPEAITEALQGDSLSGLSEPEDEMVEEQPDQVQDEPDEQIDEVQDEPDEQIDESHDETVSELSKSEPGLPRSEPDTPREAPDETVLELTEPEVGSGEVQVESVSRPTEPETLSDESEDGAIVPWAEPVELLDQAREEVVTEQVQPEEPALDEVEDQILTDQVLIEEQPETPDATPNPRSPESEQQADDIALPSFAAETETGSSKRSPLVLAAIGAALLLVVFLAFWFYFSSGSEQPAQNTPAATAASKPPDGMVLVPGGEFTMGRDDATLPEERPAHKATVGPFYMDKYEVTNEKYAEFVHAMNHPAPPGWKNSNYPNGTGKLPVVGVSWSDASEYAKWAGKRLPTEQEWEFAARGQDGRLYPWGDDWGKGQANVDGASKVFAEVGKFKGASPFDIYDMVGNAGEWTSSDFAIYEGGRLSAYYEGKSNLKTRRGADFKTTKEFATTTFRFGLEATGADYDLTGFRCARDISK